MPLSPKHQAIIDRLDDAYVNFRKFNVRLVATLAEVEVEEVHLELGYASMNEFCVKRYEMTRDETELRLSVARLLQKFPQLLGPLENGEVTISNLNLLRNMIKPSNVEKLLALSSNKTKEEVKELIAEHYPAAPAENSMREARPDAGMPLPKRPEVEPVAKNEYELLLRFDRAFHDEIEALRELMLDENPTGDLLELTRLAFRALHEKKTKSKFAATDKPAQNPRPSNDPTAVTAATKREVVARDGMRCIFVGAEGHVCGSRKRLEFDHIDLRSRGGLGTAENVRLYCHVHNLYVARKALGKKFVDDKIAAARAASAERRSAKAAAEESAAVPEVQTSKPSSEAAEKKTNPGPKKKAPRPATKARPTIAKTAKPSPLPVQTGAKGRGTRGAGGG